ncbi:unnamed protein product [Alternaria alternata]
MSMFDYSTTASDVVAAFPMQVMRRLVSPVIKEISEISPTTKAHFVAIDLLSLSSVRTAAASVAALVPEIDVLLNNAGIMGAKLARTPEGVESQFAANHIGHFLLTNLLGPQLEQAKGNARVVNVSSRLYQFSPVNYSDPQFTSTPWNTWEAYGQSKTANVLFSIALSRKLESKGVRAILCIQETPNTQGWRLVWIQRDWPIVMKMFEQKKMEMSKEKTLEQGAATSVAAALDPRLDNYSGAFLDDCQVAKVLDYASSEDNAENLWALSEKIVGETFFY